MSFKFTLGDNPLPWIHACPECHLFKTVTVSHQSLNNASESPSSRLWQIGTKFTFKRFKGLKSFIVIYNSYRAVVYIEGPRLLQQCDTEYTQEDVTRKKDTVVRITRCSCGVALTRKEKGVHNMNVWRLSASASLGEKLQTSETRCTVTHMFP